MKAEVVAVVPSRDIAVDQRNPILSAMCHVVDMRDGVQPPCVIQSRLKPLQAHAFCLCVIAGFFHSKRETS